MPPTASRQRRIGAGFPGAAGEWRILLVFVALAVLGFRGVQASKRSTRESAEAVAESVAARGMDSYSGDLTRALDSAEPLMLYPVPPQPAPGTYTQELYETAARSRSGDSDSILTRLESQHTDEVSAAGIPLLPLVEWTLLQRTTRPADLEARADALGRAAVREHPSILTPELLKSADALLAQDHVAQNWAAPWLDQWDRDEEVRKALLHDAASLAVAPPQRWMSGGNGKMWWITSSKIAGEYRFVSRKTLASAAKNIVSKVNALLPDYASAGLSFAGLSLLDPQPGGDVLARLSNGDIALAILLTAPDRLYAQQRRQTLWLAALLACALAAVAGGFWTLRRALAQEQRLSELKSDFVSSVSHELRAPLAAMRLMAENLEQGAVSSQARRDEYYHLLARECRRLSALIDNILDFARIEQNRRIYDFSETDVCALVADAVQLMQPRLAERRQHLVTETEPIEPPPEIDPLAVCQAVVNLLDNAIKFSPEGTAITVRLRGARDGSWQLSVADQGPGIPPSEQAKIFERFYRAGPGLQRETHGAGIGLSIVKHIAEAHGGQVKVESSPGAGATFTLLFPASRARNPLTSEELACPAS